MSIARQVHTATLLGNGKVLVAGGTTAHLASSELYDPGHGDVVRPTGPSITARTSTRRHCSATARSSWPAV